MKALFLLNTFGPLRLVRGLLPGMRERGTGRLIFVSSIQGRPVPPVIGPYGASKWALEAFAETLAIEAGHFGVTVTLVRPGAVSSGGAERARSFIAKDGPLCSAARPTGLSARRVRTPEEVAVTVADALEQDDPPLRVPVGAPARAPLEARKAAPEDRPFLPVALDW